jgi:hypothetical protein
MNDSTIKTGVTVVVERLLKQHGSVKPTQLLQAARPKNSPAHAGFTWDNDKAGEEFRLVQARNWLRTVRIVYQESVERLVHIPSRGNSEKNEGFYKTTSAIISIPDEFSRALSEATATLHAARRAVEELRAAVDRDPSADRSAMVSQISKGLELMATALQMVH